MPWQSSEYILDSKYEYSLVLNMQELQGSKYVGSKYVKIWLNMSKWNVNMSDYVWLYDNRHFEYGSYSI